MQVKKHKSFFDGLSAAGKLPKHPTIATTLMANVHHCFSLFHPHQHHCTNSHRSNPTVVSCSFSFFSPSLFLSPSLSFSLFLILFLSFFSFSIFSIFQFFNFFNFFQFLSFSISSSVGQSWLPHPLLRPRLWQRRRHRFRQALGGQVRPALQGGAGGRR